MKFYFVAAFAALAVLAIPSSALAYSHSYGGGHHSGSHGGTYIGGSGSSHRGGHYSGPYGGYGCHKC